VCHAAGCPAWPATKQHLIWAVAGDWAAGRAPRCAPNTTTSSPGSVGPVDQTRRGGPSPPGFGWPRPGCWAGLARTTFPNTPFLSLHPALTNLFFASRLSLLLHAGPSQLIPIWSRPGEDPSQEKETMDQRSLI